MSNKTELLNEAVQCITRLHEIATEIAELERTETISGVYIIRSGEYYKIGASSDIWSRVSQLQGGNPLPLEVVKIVRCTSVELNNTKEYIQTIFESKRERGDWFRLSGSDIRLIDKEGLYVDYDLFIRLLDIFRGVTVQIEPVHNKEIDVLATGISKSTRDKTRLIIDLIQELELEFSGSVPIETLLDRAEDVHSIDRLKADEIMRRLKTIGEIFEIQPGFIKLT